MGCGCGKKNKITKTRANTRQRVSSGPKKVSKPASMLSATKRKRIAQKSRYSKLKIK